MYRNFIKEYFTFSLSARRGIWILIVIIIIVFSIPYIYSLMYKEKNDLPDKDQIREFDKALVKIKNERNCRIVSLTNYKFFDPNLISKEEWMKNGVSYKISGKIENYIKKGGRFRKKEDLLKIYGFDKTIYSRLSPYFKFQTDTLKKTSKKYITKEQTGIKHEVIVELNSANSIMLEKLPGITKPLSIRIIKYRNLLGGFYKREQLSEVYGFTKSIYDSIRSLVKVDSTLIIKIKLNEATEKQLAKHPYVGKFKAAGIIKLKKFLTRIQNIDELVKNGIITADETDKLIYYLSIE
jgi:competence protein ComEA